MRLDKYLQEMGFFPSREKASQAIKEKRVLVDNKICQKHSFDVQNQTVNVLKEKEYVSRGAYKLLKAVETFDIDFKEKIVLDIGSSTGGFTQVALEKGAKKVYALDVGKDELAPILRQNSNVVSYENTDFREVDKALLPDVEIVIGDVSFISLRHIFPKIKQLFGAIEIVMLFKPQFECGNEIARKYKGVIKNRAIHKKLLKDFIEYIKGLGFIVSGLTFSSIKGKSGNIEYLFHLNSKTIKPFNVDLIVGNAFEME